MNIRNIHRLLCASGLAVGLASTSARSQVTATWLAPTSGTWNDPTRWSTGPIFPNNAGGQTYNAIIAVSGSAFNVDLSIPITIQNLTLSSADATLRLLGSNNVTLNQGLTLSGRANITGQSYTGELRARGASTLAGAQLTGLGMTYFDGGISFVGAIADDINDTCVVHGGSGQWAGNRDIRLSGMAGLILTAGSTFTIASTGSIIWDQIGSTAAVKNKGTLIKTSAGATNFTNVTFDNSNGVLDVRSGTLSMNSYTIVGNQLTQGAWKVSGGGNIDLQGVTVLTNAADVTLSGTSSSFAAFNSVTNNAAAGTLSVEGGRVFTTAGDFTNDGLLSVAASSNFTVLSGSSLTNYNSGTGTLSGGTFTINGTLKFDNTGVNVIDSALTLDGVGSSISTTTNTNALAVTNKITTNGALSLKNGKSFTTGANFIVEGNNSGVLDIDSTSEFAVGLGFTLDNYDSAQKKLSQGDFRVAGKLQFQHSGIEILDSKLTLDGTGAQLVDDANVDALVDLKQVDALGAFTLKNNATFTANPADNSGFIFTVASAGRINVEDGSQLDILGDLVNYSAGSFTSGEFNVGGTLRARNITSITTILTSIGLDSPTSTITNFSNIDVFETVNTIASSGSFRISNGRQLTFNDAVGVVNNGSLTVGRVSGVNDTATLTILQDYTQSGGSSLTIVQNGGRLIVEGDYNMTEGELRIVNSNTNVVGDFNHSGGTVGLGIGASLNVVGAYVMTGGDLALGGGSLTAGAATFTGGVLSGDGLINGDLVTSGTINPGGAGGRLASEMGRIFVTGNLTMQADASAFFDLASPTPGSSGGYDQLNTFGTLTIEPGAVLVLRTIVRPSVGEIFVPLVFGTLVGQFSRIEGLVISSTMYYVPIQTPNSLGFIVVEVPGTASCMAPIGAMLITLRRRRR